MFFSPFIGSLPRFQLTAVIFLEGILPEIRWHLCVIRCGWFGWFRR